MRRRALALLLFVGCLLAPAVPGLPEESGEVLLPGTPIERPIGAGEKYGYRVEVKEETVLVTVEQRGIDLVVEARGPADALTVDAGDRRWGPEILVLKGAGGYQIEVRPREQAVGPGHYTIRLEALPASSAEDVRRRAALSLMSRAGREAFAQTPQAQRRALALYRDALAEWRSLGERRWEAESLCSVAFLELQTGEPRPAVEHSLRALALWRELAEPHFEATALGELGAAYLSSGEIEKAREALGLSLGLWQRLGERADAADLRMLFCYLEQISGAMPAALACYEDVRAQFHELGNLRSEGTILNNLGGIYDALGEPDSALACYRQSLALRRERGDRRNEARILSNMATVHVALGEWQEALRLCGQAREILRLLGDRDQEAKLLTNIGAIYYNLGEPQRALAFLEDALELHRKAGNRVGEISALAHLGSIWRRLGNPRKALDFQRRALALATALQDAKAAAVIRIPLAEDELDLGDPAAALREIDSALAYLREKGIRQQEVQALDLRGRALALAGRAREALPVLREALAGSRSQRDPSGEALTLQALAAAERTLGLHDEARAHAEEAVARVEELRAGFVSPDLRAAFLATRRRAYSLLIDLLMDRHAADPGGGWDRAAFAVSERARARSLLDVLGSASAGHTAGTGPAELLERRGSLRRRLSAKADLQLKQSGEKAEALGREIEALLAELDTVDAEIRRQDPHYAAFSEPPPIGPEEAASLLDPGTLLLEYALGEERSVLWVIGAGGLRSFILPPQREVEALARRAYKELSTVEAGAARRGAAAEALGNVLLGPVWSAAARAGRLVVVPDAALHSIPFGALPVPGPGHAPLLEHAEVDYLPSATTLALQRQRLADRAPAPKRAAIFADPVFAAGDARLTGRPAASRQTARAGPQHAGEAGGPLPVFERLPSSQKEAETIAGLAPPGEVWAALGLAADREAALSGALREYRVIHFATHALADPRTPELSGLVLSLVDAAGRPREGFLGLSDIYELDLAADLVVLSGCRTALGKEVRGEGLMGLTRGFLYAGVPRVVASLWPVQDRAATELMARFYRAMWWDGQSPAAALHQAQRSMRRDPRYRDPYSWAGFVLQGDWR